MTGTEAPEPLVRTAEVEVVAEGDCALMVRFGAGWDDGAAAVRAAVDALERTVLPSRCELVPSYRAVLVCYDPLEATNGQMAQAVGEALDGLEPRAQQRRRVVEVPVCYGGCYGPDLDAVAHRAGMGADEVVRLHAARTYRIDMLGFLPGFAYLSGLDPRLATPRLEVPRTCIPAGSVGIGGSQTGVYPVDSPGGWRLIGRTPACLYDPCRAEPIAYRAGDWMRFIAIDAPTFESLALDAAAGCPVLRVVEEGIGEHAWEGGAR